MSPLGHDEIFFKVKHNGEVRWEPPGLYVTHCDFNVVYYPFDYQMCSIEVLSFAFTNKAVAFNSVSESSKNLKKNGEWVLHSLRGNTQNLTENGEEFSQVEFKVILKRLSRYYVNNVVYPVVVISLLTNVVFLVPAESGCKISYILTVLLTQAVLLTLIGNSMPTTSIQIPIIGKTNNMTFLYDLN